MWVGQAGHRRKASQMLDSRQHFTTARDHCPPGNSHTKEKLHISPRANVSRILQPCSPLNPHKEELIKVTSVEKI